MRTKSRRAFRDYEIKEKVEAGIVLTGAEVKSVKSGRISLEEAFVKLLNGEAYLVNAFIAPYEPAGQKGGDFRRTRKLLLHRAQIRNWQMKLNKERLTLVPTFCYTKAGKVKLEVALARGKREYEKKEAKRRQDLEREAEAELKGRKLAR